MAFQSVNLIAMGRQQVVREWVDGDGPTVGGGLCWSVGGPAGAALPLRGLGGLGEDTRPPPASPLKGSSPPGGGADFYPQFCFSLPSGKVSAICPKLPSCK